VFQTSANRSGEAGPSRFGDIDARILTGADLAIDAGELGGEPSTVVDVAALDRGGSWRILREGAISEEEVRRLLGPDRGS
jgi:tRNA A37 threonylcarbamoyladenosine synthetase subunit TsaC/SUA5/YrdC